MTSTEFRGRVRRHKHSFITESKSNETTLSKYIWDNELNRAESDSIIEPVVHWSILKECTGGRGRPHTTYLKNLSDWCKRSQAEVIHATEDREEWRSVVRRAARAASDHVQAD